MADEQYRWLDRETAERLLRGESLEAVDAADRDQAERLAKTLEALTVEPPLISAELPGEAAALAAFRAARADRDDASATVGHGSGSQVTDSGLVRIGAPARAARRPRWGRPVRLGLAAALAVGMVGGVAVAAGTGVLPTPFDTDERGRPAASVPAAPPERPLISPSPGSGVQGEPTPDGDAEAPTDSGTAPETEPGGPATDRGSDGDRDEHSGGWWKAVTSSCRDVRDGKQLSLDRRRTLESAAGSSARVWKYCKSVLADAGESAGPQGGEDGDKGKGDDEGKGNGKGDDQGHPAGSGGNGGRDDHRTDGAGETPSTEAGLLSDRAPHPTPSAPSPSYSAL